MISLPTAIEGMQMTLKELEDKLKPLRYNIGGGWEYDKGYFDYKIDQNPGYTFLRLPFHAIDGEIGQRGVTVELGQPFLLRHQYEAGLDDDVVTGGVLNQFQTPVDKDAAIDPKFKRTAQSLIQELELTLLYSNNG
ncbi:hypothetical protein GN156_04530 [bacterium LRH843]|nr:hypothetical protein [bacterium LRH843]